MFSPSSAIASDECHMSVFAECTILEGSFCATEYSKIQK